MHSTSACPCCGHRAPSEFLDLGTVPWSGIYRRDQTCNLPTLHLKFELCASCGLVMQRPPFPGRNYTEVNRPPKRRLPPYVWGILDTLRSASVHPGDLVLEIGCNDGSFLAALREAGYSNLLGIEPSKELCAGARLTGATIINDYFSRESAGRILARHGAPRAVICRHTLEHVPDIEGFVEGIKTVAQPGAAITLIEVPDSAVITDRGYFFELWDEHLYYFHAANLARLMARKGFDVAGVRAVEHQETGNILVTLGPEQGPAFAPRPSPYEAWRAFGATWSVLRERLQGALIHTRKPVYLIGAGHLQTNFVNFLGPRAEVDCLIDDDCEKVGRIAPVTAGDGRIIATDEFVATATTGTVVATGFGYPAWSERILGHARLLGLDIIDPRKAFRDPIQQARR